MPLSTVGVIFDCDGTLIDSMGIWREVEGQLAKRANACLSKADTDELTTLTIPEAGAFFHNRFGLGENADDVVRMMDELLLEYYRTKACERPGALAFVKGLVERGVQVSVASSSPQVYLQAGLACAGFSPYISTILSVDDVGASKREPVVYDRAREIMGTSLETTWGFEDSAYALKTLCEAGYRSVGIFDRDDAGTHEELAAYADVVIDSFEELSLDAFLSAVESRKE